MIQIPELELLKKLVAIHAPSGEEAPMKAFLLEHIQANQASWKTKPQIVDGPEWQDGFLLVFGKPRCAALAHMDSIGYTVRYENQLVAIGGPQAESGTLLKGQDRLGPIECKLLLEDGEAHHDFARSIQRGTSLTYVDDFQETDELITSPYLDNRLGVFVALQLCKTLENGVIGFTCYEEHGGGYMPMVAKYLYEQLSVRQALVCDITWVTEGVVHGEGVALSLRDRNIPRQSFVQKLAWLLEESDINYQLEVEGSGSSDGRELHHSPYPFDWAFLGAPEDNVHTPKETVHKADILSMIAAYRYLMEEL